MKLGFPPEREVLRRASGLAGHQHLRGEGARVSLDELKQWDLWLRFLDPESNDQSTFGHKKNDMAVKTHGIPFWGN